MAQNSELQQRYEAQLATEQAYAIAAAQQQQQQQQQQYAGQNAYTPGVITPGGMIGVPPVAGTPGGVGMPTQVYPNQVYAAGGPQNYVGMPQYAAPGYDPSGAMYAPNQAQYGQQQQYVGVGVPQAGMQQTGVPRGAGGVNPGYPQQPPGYLSRGGFKQFGSFRDSMRRGTCCTIS